MQRPVVAGIVLAAALVVGAGVSWRHAPHDASAPAATVAGTATYQCPMHPQVVAHEPGRCPVCGMTLARNDAAGDAQTGGKTLEAGVVKIEVEKLRKANESWLPEYMA